MSNAVAVMTGLVEFYRARLDDQEWVATELKSGIPWHVIGTFGRDGRVLWRCTDPDGLLSQVAAHRKILDQYENWCRLYEERASHDMARASMGQVLDELERVVLALVQVHAEHPEFRQEWKVG